MQTMQPHLLDELLDELGRLECGDDDALRTLRAHAETILRESFGQKSRYLTELERIDFYPGYGPPEFRDSYLAWTIGVSQLADLINRIKKEHGLTTKSETASGSGVKVTDSASNSVFIVHGHDEELKQSVARSIERLGLASVILHEKPNKGRTIIEKFHEYSNVGFAVVLLSADDVARAKNVDDFSYRARQNVIFELGFFLGRLGRERVAAIFRPHPEFEIPSDYAGVIFIEYDKEGVWRYKLAQELRACGYMVSLDSLA